MFSLNALWYGPVLAEQDDRNEKLLKTLSEATDALAKAEEIQADYTTKIREAREKATEQIQSFRKDAMAQMEVQLQSAESAGKGKVTAAQNRMNEELDLKMKASQAEIDQRADRLVQATFAEFGI